MILQCLAMNTADYTYTVFSYEYCR